MTKLRDGSSLLLWRQGDLNSATAVGSGLPPLSFGPLTVEQIAALAEGDLSGHAEALGGHVTDGDPGWDDPVSRLLLADLDRMFGGWLPGLFEAEAERIELAEAMASRRRLVTAPRLARPTLPVCAVRRARIIEGLAPKRVALDDDVDGVSILLARAGIEVVVAEPDPVRRRWLASEADRAGTEAGLEIAEDGAIGGDFDVAVVGGGPPHETHRALSWAGEVTGPGGHILFGLRAPWDDHFFAAQEGVGLELIDHVREIDVTCFPGGYVVDGPGDVIVLKRGANLSLPDVDLAPEGRVREQPYYWLDFDELDAKQLGDRPLERLADLIAAQHPVPEVTRSISQSEGRELITWFDQNGVGFTAQLASDAGHLLVTMVPYDLSFEYTLMCAVFHLLADHLTRVRPQLTMKWRGESIVA